MRSTVLREKAKGVANNELQTEARVFPQLAEFLIEPLRHKLYYIVYHEKFFIFQSYTLTGLNTYTQYLVSLRAYNPAGDGPETIVVVMTDEGGML